MLPVSQSESRSGSRVQRNTKAGAEMAMLVVVSCQIILKVNDDGDIQHCTTAGLRL